MGGKRWTREEIKLLNEIGDLKWGKELLEKFPGRTLSGIKNKKSQLGIRTENTFSLDQNITLDSLDNDEYQILMGSFLGDGSIISRDTWSKCIFYEKHSVMQSDYVKWKSDRLRTFSANFNDNGYPFFSTPMHDIFTKMREYSYVECDDLVMRKNKLKKKWINRLDLLGLLIWYLDDGCFTRRGDGCNIKISAKCFRNHIDYVANSFHSRYSIILNTNPVTGSIYFTSQAVSVVLPIWQKIYHDYNMPECMKYKFGFDLDLRNISNVARKRPINGNKEWSDDELKFLEDNYMKITDEELAEALPGRTYNAVHSKLHKLGLTRMWKDYEIKLLKNNYAKMTNNELMAYLPHRTYQSISNKLSRLGLNRIKKL